MYGRFMDKNFRENTFSHYTGLLSYNNEYIYRRCYFRTKPSQPFCVTVGMQAAGEFGGVAYQYQKGSITRTENRASKSRIYSTCLSRAKVRAKAFIKATL